MSGFPLRCFVSFKGFLGNDLAWTLLSVVACIVILTVVGPVVTADTPTYVEHAPFRSGLVPAMLWLTRAVAGPWSFQVFVAFNAALTAVATARFATSVGLAFGIGTAGHRVVHLLLLGPALRFAPEVGSVATAFSLCLLWLADAVRQLQQPADARALHRLYVWQALAALTRSQMLVLVPFTVAAAIRATARTRKLRPALLCIAWLVAGMLAGRAYQRAVNGIAATEGSLGIQLLTTVAYGMTADDLSCLEPGRAREFTTHLHARLEEQRLLESGRPLGVPTSHHFEVAYTRICWGTIVPLYGRSALGMALPESAAVAPMLLPPGAWRRMDDFTTGVAIQLVRCNPWRYVSRTLRIVYETQKLFLLVMVILFGVGITLPRTGAGQALILISLLWATNTVVVAGLEYPMLKYTYYFGLPAAGMLMAALLAWRALLTETEQSLRSESESPLHDSATDE